LHILTLITRESLDNKVLLDKIIVINDIMKNFEIAKFENNNPHFILQCLLEFQGESKIYNNIIDSYDSFLS
jgi:hypothetical protein